MPYDHNEAVEEKESDIDAGVTMFGIRLARLQVMNIQQFRFG